MELIGRIGREHFHQGSLNVSRNAVRTVLRSGAGSFDYECFRPFDAPSPGNNQSILYYAQLPNWVG